MSDIELIEETEFTKRCYRYKERLFGHLNITYNESNSMFIFWNKYQIFIHEDQNYEIPTRIYIPEFQVRQIIATNNYLICLDCSGNVHLASLKFKNAAQKRFKSSFQIRKQGILHCIKYSTDLILCLKVVAQTYFLCLNKINSDFNVDKKYALTNTEDWPLHCSKKEKYILYSYEITKDDLTNLNGIFKIVENEYSDHRIILISFDKLTVYACLFSQKSTSEATNLLKLYTCSTEICDLIIIEKDGLNLLIGLVTGTLIEIPFKNVKKSPDINIFHLNAALSKFVMAKTNDYIIYTDGVTMWKAKNVISKENIKFRQFFVKDVKDFIKCGDEIICTTFSNLIYTFSSENDKSYLKSDDDAYCPAENLLNNSEYLYKISQEVEKNNEVINQIIEEENYITALSLSKRQDIMDDIIQQKIMVYENYQDVVNENTEVTLTEDLVEYFKSDSLFFLMKVTASTVQHELSSVLSNLLGDLRMHVTFISEEIVLKTTSIKIKEPLKNLDVLIPLRNKNITQINAEIKLVYKIPGVFDKNQSTWTILHKKCLKLNAEHFIKTNYVFKCVNLKEPQEPIEELIIKINEIQHGDLFKITDKSKQSIEQNSLTFYLKLPNNYVEILCSDGNFYEHLNSRKSAMIQKQVIAEDFLKSKSYVIFEIGTEKVKLEIINDEFFNPLLKVASKDGKIGFDIRNFFANMMYNDYTDFGPGREFVNNSLYTTTENLQKAMKNCIDGSEDEILLLAEQFQKNVGGALPI